MYSPRTRPNRDRVRNHSDIRAAVEATFSSREFTPLCGLLGFAAARVTLPAVLDVLRARSRVTIDDVCSFGSRGTLTCYCLRSRTKLHAPELAQVTRALRTSNYAQLQLYLIADADFSECVIASFGLGEQLLTLTLERDRLRASDLETLQEMLPGGDESGIALAARHARALDRSRVTRRFFSDFAAQRDALAAAWLHLGAQQRRDREQLALLLLSRLMFLYFLQHRGYLGRDTSYLVRRFRSWRSRISFYSGTLKPLFFHVLNRRPARRPERARSFGDLPYLNGGLFERHTLERKHARLDLPDRALAPVFDDLLERYRFTAREASEAEIEGVHDVGVDAEMLGRVFEGLMAARARATTGTFYTPAATVDRLVCNTLVAHLEPRIGAAAATSLVREGCAESLDAYQRQFTSRLLRDTRVLDPACGSGAFLLGALARVAAARAALENSPVMAVRRDAVAHSLYGVDLQSDAAMLCALRLWLALVPGDHQQAVQPLPNLDRQIRQGDSLVDPLDLRTVSMNAEVGRCIADLQPASAAYVMSEPEQRPALQRLLLRSERRLARAWVTAHQRRVAYEAAELRATSQEKDLFGGVTSAARAARAELGNVRQRAAMLSRLARAIRAKDERPFFSFGVHFPDAALHGFDVVLCNPPWVRSHNWPRAITGIVRRRYEVCRAHSWHPPGIDLATAGGGNQIDLALLFLERAIELLAPGGALGIVLPAKFMRSLSGSAARRLLLERTDIVSIEDHSLDQRSIFAADAFASLIVARKRGETGSLRPNPVHVTAIKRNAKPLSYTVQQRDLPLFTGDGRAPWLLVPTDVRRALLRMREGVMIGAHAELQVRRGIVTGANDVMLLTRAEEKLSGLAAIRAEGFAGAANPADYVDIVEQCAIAPAARGCDVAAWRFSGERSVLCRLPRNTDALPRLSNYLQKHGRSLADLPKVGAQHSMLAWHDLASTLEAVVMPASIVPINTVYFIHADEERAHLLAAYFNSRPLRTFARALAERAKDAHFRFFAWTVSMLPLPPKWRTFEAGRLCELSELGHALGALDTLQQNELDEITARAFGLTRGDVRALESFDAWLRPA